MIKSVIGVEQIEMWTTITVFLSFLWNCFCLKLECIILKKICVEYSCFEKCSGTPYELSGKEMMVCGNSSFSNCFNNYHNNDSLCANQYQNCLSNKTTTVRENDGGGGQMLKTIGTTIGIMFLVGFFFLLACCLHQQKTLWKRKKEDLVKQIEGRSQSSKKKNILNKDNVKSVWDNIYISTIKDYDTSDEEETYIQEIF